MTTLHRARESFSFDLDGVPHVVRGGEIVAAEDPRFTGHEAYFEAADVAISRATERATAAPGEARHLPITTPPKRTSQK